MSTEVPKIAYFTILDYYVYACFTCSAVLMIEVCFCAAYCSDAVDSTLLWATGTAWALFNIAFVWHVRRAMTRAQELRAQGLGDRVGGRVGGMAGTDDSHGFARGRSSTKSAVGGRTFHFPCSFPAES